MAEPTVTADVAGVAGPLVLVGCGRMGTALLDGWLRDGMAESGIHVVEPDPRRRDDLAWRGVDARATPDALSDVEPRALVFAVKPQAMAEVLPACASLAAGGAVVLSIAAGTVAARFTTAFGPRTPVVRAMPNTPAAIGRGASVLWANPRVGPEQRLLCQSLLAAVGEVHWVEDEEAMHAVTAVSGGGPAYVFLLIEALAAAGVKAGLHEELATKLARATVAGAGALAESSAEPPASLRRNVTSPGGTTQAALAVLMADDGGLGPLFDEAVAAAVARSRELA